MICDSYSMRLGTRYRIYDEVVPKGLMFTIKNLVLNTIKSNKNCQSHQHWANVLLLYRDKFRSVKNLPVS